MPTRLKRMLQSDDVVVCVDCGVELTQYNADVDHEPPLADGGCDSQTELRCVPCHRKKTEHENSLRVPMTHGEIIRNVMRAATLAAPEQVHKSITIQQLRTWWNDKFLRRAECNRLPVWDVGKRRKFVMSVIQGRIVPPMYFNHVRSKDRMEIYDGMNRIHSIMQFMDGEAHIVVNHGRQRIEVAYAPKPGCVEMTPAERRRFENRTIDYFEWPELSESAACKIAQGINQGTPMSSGEKINLILGFSTQRANALRMLYTSVEFLPLRFGDRYKDLKLLADLFRHVLEPGYVFSGHVGGSHYSALQRFYESDAPLPAAKLEEMQARIREMRRLFAATESEVCARKLTVAFLACGAQCDRIAAMNDGSDLEPPRIVEKWA